MSINLTWVIVIVLIGHVASVALGYMWGWAKCEQQERPRRYRLWLRCRQWSYDNEKTMRGWAQAIDCANGIRESTIKLIKWRITGLERIAPFAGGSSEYAKGYKDCIRDIIGVLEKTIDGGNDERVSDTTGSGSSSASE